MLQTLQTSPARGIEQKVIVAPIAQTKRTLVNPGHEHERHADLKAQHDIEEYG